MTKPDFKALEIGDDIGDLDSGLEGEDVVGTGGGMGSKKKRKQKKGGSGVRGRAKKPAMLEELEQNVSVLEEEVKGLEAQVQEYQEKYDALKRGNDALEQQLGIVT